MPKRGGRAIYTGSSMLRVFRPRDLLRARPCRIAEVRPGDIICYARDGRRIIHRVVALLPDGRVQTQGDNNARPDPYTVGDDNEPALATHYKRGRHWRPVAGGRLGRWQFRVNRLRRRGRRLVGRLLRLAPDTPLGWLKRGRYERLEYHAFGKLECLMLGERIVAERRRRNRGWVVLSRVERFFLSAVELDRRFPRRGEAGDGR